MGHFIYSNTKMKSKGRAQPYDEQDATLHYCKHYANWLDLDEMSKDYKVTFLDRRQVENEIVIAQRKMFHWERHMNFNLATASQVIMMLKNERNKNRQKATLVTA